MKKQALFILMSFALIAGNAQTQEKHNRPSFSSTVGSGFALTSPSTMPFIWHLSMYYSLSDRWDIGIGAGSSFYEDMLLPAFGTARFQIGRARLVTPYVAMDAGYSFSVTNNADGGFLLNPSFGIFHLLKNGVSLQFALGWEYQQMKLRQSHSDIDPKVQCMEKLEHQLLSIQVGIRF